jgi:hypothetical protein
MKFKDLLNQAPQLITSTNKLTETLKKQFDENIEIEYQGRIYDIPSEAYLTTNHDEFITVHLLQDSQWVKLLTVDEFNKLEFFQ